MRTLYESPIVVVRDCDCRHGHGGPGSEESSEADTIVLMRHGAFCRHYGNRTVTSDVNQAAFFPGGTAHRVSHPAESGDRGMTFAVPPRVLGEIVRELGRPPSPMRRRGLAVARGRTSKNLEA